VSQTLLMALVRRRDFERLAPGAAPGAVVPLETYPHKKWSILDGLAGGRLFLVTVRPPDERVWLIGVLENPTLNDKAWVAEHENDRPIVDITDRLAGLSHRIAAAAGALAMAFQDPIPLTEADAALLLEPRTSGLEAPTRDHRRDQFLYAINEAPEDDAPRLAYAEWLTKRGDDRGELITVQCTLARGKASGLDRRAMAELRARERKLLRAPPREWMAPVERIASGWTFMRGFIEDVHADSRLFLPDAGALFAVEPVTRLRLRDVTRTAAEALANAPWVPRIRRLRIRGSAGDRGLGVLVSAPNLAHLDDLNAGDMDLGRATADALASSSLSVVSLCLTGNPLGDDGLEALLGRPSLLARCRRLYLARCNLTDRGARILADAPQLATLTGLCLGGNDISEGAARALAASPHLSSLKRLELDALGASPTPRSSSASHP